MVEHVYVYSDRCLEISIIAFDAGSATNVNGHDTDHQRNRILIEAIRRQNIDTYVSYKRSDKTCMIHR